MIKKYGIWIFSCLIILIFSCFLLIFRKRIVFNVSSDKVLVDFNSNYDSSFVSACYGNIFSCDNISVVSDDFVDTSKIGLQRIKYSAKYGDYKKDKYIDVVVVDRENPEIQIFEDSISVCPSSDDYDVSFKTYDNYDGDLTGATFVNKYFDRAVLIARDSSFNASIISVPVKHEDLVAPEVSLIGNKEMTILINSNFIDPGVIASDNCDGDITKYIEVSNNVDTSKVGIYNVNYSVIDNAGNQSVISRVVNVINQSDTSRKKVIYLTFDDGPSEYTGELLDILANYNIKATFFVTGRNSKYEHFITRAYNEGHAIGLHTNTHNYSLIYQSVDAYFDDLNLINEKVKKLTGSYSYLLRFPGGSSNTVSKFNPGIMTELSKLVEAKGYKYFDWNVSSEDATGKIFTPDEYALNVINGLGNRDTYIVLQHDTNVNSVRAVDKIIQYGLSNGYRFEVLTNMSPTIHHRINN